MKILKTFEEYYTQEWPMSPMNVGLTQDDIEGSPEFNNKENKFQDVQERMKLLLKPILLKKNNNVDDNDVEKVSDSFFKLGNNKSREIKQMVDNCKDTEQCAKEIINKYLKYVKINFGRKDNINDAEFDGI